MTRSLRRVLLPLVLLSGIAFRWVGFGAGGAPELLPLPPTPPRLALPGAAGPGEDGPAVSTEVVAAATPKKKPGEFLVLPRARRSEQSSVVSSDSGASPRSEIRINNNGTIQLVDGLSNSPLWEISTGPPPSEEVTTGDSALSYVIYPVGGNGNELMEFNNGTSVILPWKLEDFVARTPYIQDSVVTIVSKVSTVFVIDVDRGESIYKRRTPAVLNELKGPLVEGTLSKVTDGTDDTRGNILIVVRNDYSLSASDLGKHLFNWTRSFFTAHYHIHNHPNTLDQPSYLQGETPCIKTEGVPLALPDSTSSNTIFLQDALPVAPRNADALKPHRTSRKLPQTDGKSHVALDSAQNQTHDADSEATNKFTKNTYGWLFPVFPILLVIGYLLSLTSASRSCRQFVRQLMKPFMCDKKPVDVRGRAEGTPNKRRKQRKRDGLVNVHEILSASDKENSETGGSADTLIKENSILTNKGINGLDGRQIGKLYVYNKEIGRGSNGTVVFYDGRQVAVKRLLRSHNDIAVKETENLIMSDRDPNIVRLYGCERDSDFVYISLERCKCSLADLIQKHSASHVTVGMNSKISNAEGIDVNCGPKMGFLRHNS